MKYVPLIWVGVWRNPVRAVLTALSIVVAFALFGLLGGIDQTFRHLDIGMGADLVHIRPRFSSPLPYAHLATIEALPGLARVAPIAQFNGYFQDPRNGVYGTATHPKQWFAMNPQFAVSKAQVDDLTRTRTGVIVGVATMSKYGWKIGERVPLESTLQRRDGSTIWTFDILGVYGNAVAPGDDDHALIFNYEYLDEGRAQGNGTANGFEVEVTDPKRIGGTEEAIDKAFANSPAETRSLSEIELLNYRFSQSANLSFLVTTVVGGTFFVLLFLTGNTMVQSARERIPEFAVMKTIGFSDQGLLALIVAESFAICLAAAAIGLAIAWYVYPLITSIRGLHPPLQVVVIAMGIGLALTISVVSALPAVWTIMRHTIVQALAEQS